MSKTIEPLERRLNLLYTAARKDLSKSNIQYASRHVAAAAIYCNKAGKEVPKRFVELAAKIIQADYEMSVILGATETN